MKTATLPAKLHSEIVAKRAEIASATEPLAASDKLAEQRSRRIAAIEKETPKLEAKILDGDRAAAVQLAALRIELELLLRDRGIRGDQDAQHEEAVRYSVDGAQQLLALAVGILFVEPAVEALAELTIAHHGDIDAARREARKSPRISRIAGWPRTLPSQFDQASARKLAGIYLRHLDAVIAGKEPWPTSAEATPTEKAQD